MTERHEQLPFAVPSDATEILLVRHGATIAAVEGESFELIEGHADPPLAPAGREQAARVCARLAEESPRAVFVSNLQRTAQTAAPLVERSGLEPQVIPELREVNLGQWEGGAVRIHAARRDPLFVRVMTEERWDVIPGAEPEDVFAARVRSAVDRIVAATGPASPVVAFAHGAVIAELCRQATASRPFAFLVVDNCSISRLVVMAGGRWQLRSFNDISHLA